MASAAIESTTLARRAAEVREQILRIGASDEGTHVGGSLSVTDILTVLYFEILNVHPEEPEWPGRDYFILSKGHAAAALYAVLSQAGYFPPEECEAYGTAGSRLAGHPLRRLPGVEFPTGSLGHGLSLGLGLALGAAAAGARNRTFVLLGDGELQEGSVWEAAMAAGHFGVDNLTAIVDRNRWQITGRTEETIRLEPLADRWRSFGWAVVQIDGHDLGEIRETLASLPLERGQPSVVLARTTKGRGVRLFEDKKKSHYIKLTPQLYERALASLQAGSAGGEA